MNKQASSAADIHFTNLRTTLVVNHYQTNFTNSKRYSTVFAIYFVFHIRARVTGVLQPMYSQRSSTKKTERALKLFQPTRIFVLIRLAELRVDTNEHSVYFFSDPISKFLLLFFLKGYLFQPQIVILQSSGMRRNDLE